jgi:hypothetical protein
MLLLNSRLMRRCCLALLIAGCICAIAQDDSPSLADAARKARESKPAAAKKVITDENLEADRGPIPALNLDGHDNTADIIRAIGEYHYKHTPEETEQVVRDWYNRYDHMMQRASDENAEIRSRQQDRRTQYREYPNDPKQYREQLLWEARSAAQDDKLLRSNGMLAGRIQSAFYKIKSELNYKYKMNYEWLKPSAQYW